MRIIKNQFIFLIVFTVVPSVAYVQTTPSQPDTNVTQQPDSLISLISGISGEVVKKALAQRDSASLGPFRLAIGASFDFINGLKANDVYADLTVFFTSYMAQDR